MDYKQVSKILRQLILNNLKIRSSSISIDDETPLIDYGFGVDSVAVLEFIVAVENEFKIDIDESTINENVIYSIKSISDFLLKNYLK